MRCSIFTLSLLTILTSPHVADAQVLREMRVFPLNFLEERDVPGSGLLSPPSLRTVDSYEEALVILDEDEDRRLHSDLVVDVITNLIAVDSWENSRNSLDTYGRKLVAVQTPDVLERIEAFTSMLETRCSRSRRLELALVPPDALDRVAPAWRRAGSSPWLDGDVLERAVEEGGERSFYASRLIQEGGWLAVVPTKKASHLVDHDVNQTGLLPVVNPRIDSLQDGAYARVRLLPAPSESWFRIDVRLGRLENLGLLESRDLPAGAIELLRSKQGEVASTAVVRPGRTVLVGAYSGVGEAANAKTIPTPFVALLRLGAPVESATETDVATGVPALIDLRLLLERVLDFDFTPVREDEAISFTESSDEDEDEPTLDEDRIQVLIEKLLDDDAEGYGLWSLAGGFLFVRGGEADTATKVREFFDRLARGRVRPVRIDIWQGGIEQTELAEKTILDASWVGKLDDKEGVRATLVGQSGASLALGAVALRGAVVDVEKVSGGTENSILEVADPIVSNVGGGILVSARAHAVPGTPWVQLRVRGERASEPTFQKVRTRAALEVEYDEDGVRGAGDWLTLDLAEQERDLWEHQVTAPAGRPVVLSVLPATDGSGTTRVLLSVVHAFQIDAEGRLQRGF